MSVESLTLITTIIILLFLLFRSFQHPYLHFAPLTVFIVLFAISLKTTEPFVSFFYWVDQQFQVHLNIVLPTAFYNYVGLATNLLLLISFLILRWLLIIVEKIGLSFIKRPFSFPGYYFFSSQYFLYKRFNGVSLFFLGTTIILTIFILTGLYISLAKQLTVFPLLLWAPLLAVLYETAVYFSGPIRWIDLRLQVFFEDPLWRWINTYNQIYALYLQHFKQFILFHIVYQKNFSTQQKELNFLHELNEQDILLTDTLNDQATKTIVTSIAYYLSMGKKVIILTHSQYPLETFYQSINPYLQEEALIDPQDIYFYQDAFDPDINFYQLYFLTFDRWESWNDTGYWDEVLPNMGMMLILHPTTMYPEIHARIAQLFKKIPLPHWIRMLIIAEKWQNTEESIRLIYNRSHLLEIQSLCANSFKRYLIVWENQPHFHHQIFPGVSYISPPAMLSLVPLNKGIDQIYWMDAGDFERDSIEILEAQILTHRSQIPELNQTSIQTEAFQLQPSIRTWEMESRRFCFIFDRFHNLPFLINYLETHGKLALEFVNILSEPYLLRSYYLSNLRYLLIFPFQELLLPIITWPSVSIRQTILALLRSLHEAPCSYETIYHTYFYDQRFWHKVYQFIHPNINNASFELTAHHLNELIALFLDDPKLHPQIREHYRWDEKKQIYCRYFYLPATHPPLSQQDFSFYLTGGDEPLFPWQTINRDNIIYYLRLNHVLILRLLRQGSDDVKSYRVESIDVTHRKIFVQHESPTEQPIFIPSIELNFERIFPFETQQVKYHDLSITYTQWFCRYERIIRNVIEFPQEIHLSNENFKILPPQGQYPDALIRKTFPISRALSIQFQYLNLETDFSEIIPRLSLTITLLLQHLFKSLFPTAHHQIKVFSPQVQQLLKQVNHTPQLKGLYYLYPAANFPTNAYASQAIDIWIVEESDNGLGVCEYLYNSRLQRVWDILDDFLEFAKDKPEVQEAIYFHLESSLREEITCEWQQLSNFVSRLNVSTYPLKTMRQTWQNMTPENFKEISLFAEHMEKVECDFCGIEIGDKAHTQLEDGRILCADCEKTAVTQEQAFKKILKRVYNDVEALFSIRLPKVTQIYVINTAELQKKIGSTFVPTPQYDPRTVGVAIQQNGNFQIYIENGAPYWNTYLTMAHELTHIWQFLVLRDLKKIPLELLEGHTTYIEYYLVKHQLQQQPDDLILKRLKDHLDKRRTAGMDVYGVGLQYFLENVGELYNPFHYMIELFGRQRR